MALILSAEKALIFRITHIANVPWLLKHGLHCESAEMKDPAFVRIGNLELILKRSSRRVPISPGGVLADYIPFYFTPHSAMLFKIETGNGGIKQFHKSEIVFIVSDLHGLKEFGVTAIYTDSHAYPITAEYFSSLDNLDRIDWDILRNRDFKRDDENDPGKVGRYQAEALIHGHLPIAHVRGMVCFGENESRTLESHCEEAGVDLGIFSRPNWYFR